MARVLLALAFVAAALPAFAQQLTLQLKDGRVTLDATGVPVRQILAEWARVGGTKIVGADKITGSPVTLHITNMPERQALDIILRNVAGFMAAPRLASATPGASTSPRTCDTRPMAPRAEVGHRVISTVTMTPGVAPPSWPGGTRISIVTRRSNGTTNPIPWSSRS